MIYEQSNKKFKYVIDQNKLTISDVNKLSDKAKLVLWNIVKHSDEFRNFNDWSAYLGIGVNRLEKIINELIDGNFITNLFLQ